MNWLDVPDKRFLNVKEAAEYLGLATSTLYTMVSQQRIPYTKMGRRTKFEQKELDRWTDSHSVKPIQSGRD